VLRITPGNMHDVMMAPELVSAAGPIERLIADKACDTNRLRSLLAENLATGFCRPSVLRKALPIAPRLCPCRRHGALLAVCRDQA